MLKVKLTNTNNINSEGTKLYLEDTTGDYSISNTTGYGTPNLERDEVAVLILGTYKSTIGDSVTTFESYNPLLVDSFVANMDKDGWYIFNLFSFAILDDDILAEGGYDNDTTLYNVATGQLGVVMDTDFVVHPLQDFLGSEYDQSSVEVLFIANISKTRNRLIESISDSLFKGVTYEDRRLIRLVNNYTTVDNILTGTIYEYGRANKYMAQRSLEFLDTNDYVCDC